MSSKLVILWRPTNQLEIKKVRASPLLSYATLGMMTSTGRARQEITPHLPNLSAQISRILQVTSAYLEEHAFERK